MQTTKWGNPRRRQSLATALPRAGVGLVLLFLASGCQVPRYQLPAGFSSTYYRFLHSPEFADPAIEEVPPAEKVLETPGIFYPQTFQYQPPTRSEVPRTVIVLPEDRPTLRRRY